MLGKKPQPSSIKNLAMTVGSVGVYGKKLKIERILEECAVIVA